MSKSDVPLESGRRARRSRCPDCHRRGVTVRHTLVDGDALGCRHCEWWAFHCDGSSNDYPVDRRELMRWELANGNPGYWNFPEWKVDPATGEPTQAWVTTRLSAPESHPDIVITHGDTQVEHSAVQDDDWGICDGDLDEDAADKLLGEMGYARDGEWDPTGSAWVATVMRA